MEYALYFGRINGTYAVFIGDSDQDPEHQIPGILASNPRDTIIWLTAKDAQEIGKAKKLLEVWHKASHPSAAPLIDKTSVQIDYP